MKAFVYICVVLTQLLHSVVPDHDPVVPDPKPVHQSRKDHVTLEIFFTIHHQDSGYFFNKVLFPVMRTFKNSGENHVGAFPTNSICSPRRAFFN